MTPGASASADESGGRITRNDGAADTPAWSGDLAPANGVRNANANERRPCTSSAYENRAGRVRPPFTVYIGDPGTNRMYVKMKPPREQTVCATHTLWGFRVEVTDPDENTTPTFDERWTLTGTQTYESEATVDAAATVTREGLYHISIAALTHPEGDASELTVGRWREIEWRYEIPTDPEPEPPGAARGLRVDTDQTRHDQVTLKFSRPRNRATGSGNLGYDIERLDDHAGVDIPVQVPHTSSEPWPSNVDEWGQRVSTTGGRTYVFRVRAKDADGTGAWSSRVRHEAPDGTPADPHPDPPGQPRVTQTNSWQCDASVLVHSDSWCARQIRVEVPDMQAWAQRNSGNDLAMSIQVRDRHSSESILFGFQASSLSITRPIRPGHHRVRARVRMDPSDNSSYTGWSA